MTVSPEVVAAVAGAFAAVLAYQGKMLGELGKFRAELRELWRDAEDREKACLARERNLLGLVNELRARVGMDPVEDSEALPAE